jgi:hypothetical protein
VATRYRTEGLVFGLGLVAVGVVVSLGNMGMLDTLVTLRRFWPALLVVWGALEIAATRAGEGS